MSAVFPNIERIDSGPAFMDKSDARPILAVHRQMAEERYTKDLELIADWICTAETDLEDCDYFGPISTAELVRLWFGGEANEQQCKAISDELRKRYLEENESRIAFDAARM